MTTRAARAAPRYAQVAADLRAEIQRGDYGAGSPMPTESALCARYGVSRFTVREALRQLQSEGLIRRRRGSGTVVDPEGGSALRQSLTDVKELLQYAAGSTYEFQSMGPVLLSPQRARDLNAEAGERWHLFEGLRTMAGHQRPIAYTSAYVHDIFAKLIPQVHRGETIFRQLERLSGIEIARVTQDIRAVGASAREAELLQIPRRSPCLSILRSYIDTQGRIVEMSLSIHPGDLFTYSMHIDEV
jgi:DNA-binding GntR family transcriptional regulator